MTTKSLLQDPDLFRQQAYLGGRWCDADNGTTAEVNAKVEALNGGRS
jgi:hypothetical protein